MALLEKVEIYPYAERSDPRPRGYITPNGRSWSAAHPRGMEYWQRLSDIINKEPVFERDRLFMAMLAPLGIEKGKPFKPTEEQNAHPDRRGAGGRSHGQSDRLQEVATPGGCALCGRIGLGY